MAKLCRGQSIELNCYAYKKSARHFARERKRKKERERATPQHSLSSKNIKERIALTTTMLILKNKN